MSGAAWAPIEVASHVAPRRTSAFLPREHGSWSLACEPLALGLLVAPSLGGAALALAAIAGFFSRRPAKAVAFPGSSARRGAPAALALLGSCAATGLWEAALLCGIRSLWPLLLAAPLAVLYLIFDLRREARAATAEIAGCAAFSLVPASLASLGGWTAGPALALAAVMCARSVPTVMALRSAVRIGKGERASRLAPVVAALAALGMLGLLASLALVPWATTVLSLLLVVRSVILARTRPVGPAVRTLGVTEAAIGAAYVTAAALAYRL